MVSNVTSFTGNGLKDWLLQRVSAVILALYILYLGTFLIRHPDLSYEQWQALFHSRWFAIASVLAVLSLSLHAWIGIWTVTTDYIKQTALRIFIQMLVASWLLAQLIWVLLMIWGQ
ncbi:MAG: succinate dehydrogenase, hydrophobic membrane anchor protein [Legionellaceae bacterium]|nr:succinate dehydrogenase, hydrophobic membrane anchor protein [Legionellaceae bacterium]